MVSFGKYTFPVKTRDWASPHRNEADDVRKVSSIIIHSVIPTIYIFIHTFIIHSYLSYLEKKTLLGLEAKPPNTRAFGPGFGSSGSSPKILSATWHQGWQQQYWSRMALKLQELNFTRRKKLFCFSCFLLGGGCSNIKFVFVFICSAMLVSKIMAQFYLKVASSTLKLFCLVLGKWKVLMHLFFQDVQVCMKPLVSFSWGGVDHWPYIVLSPKLGSSFNERRLGGT